MKGTLIVDEKTVKFYLSDTIKCLLKNEENNISNKDTDVKEEDVYYIVLDMIKLDLESTI